MGTRSKPPTLKAAQSAAESIHKRRLAQPDADRHEWGIPEADKPSDLAKYALGHQQTTPAALRDEAPELLVIAARNVAEAEYLERAALDNARAQGMTWEQIGEKLGLTAQGAQQRRLRLRGPDMDQPRDEVAVRAVIRERGEQAEAAAELVPLIRQTAVALRARGSDLPRSAVEPLLSVLWYLDNDPPDDPGPGLIPVTRNLLDALALYMPPEGCRDLLAALAARPPKQRTS